MPAPPDTVDTHKYDCQHNCRNPQHAVRILHAIRSAIQDAQIAAAEAQLTAYVAKSCNNFARVHDDNRTTALHGVARLPGSVNLSRLAEFLINHGAVVDAVESDTGRTPLHYACMFSNLAVARVLLNRGASLERRDLQQRHPLTYVPSTPQLAAVTTHAGTVSSPLRDTMETWAWGHMRNYNFGLVRDSDDDDRPQQLEMYSRIRATVRHVAVSPLHCLFVDELDNLYVVGNGMHGNLGIDTENTILEPCKVELALTHKDSVLTTAASRNTSMVLTRRFHVYTCGSNTHHQLGYDAAKQTTFRRVRFPQTPTNEVFYPNGIIAQDKYSIAFDQHYLYVWGTCVGQFGSKVKSLEANEIAPIAFPSTSIWRLATSEWAIAVCTPDSFVLLHNHQNRTVMLPFGGRLVDICMDTAESRHDPVRLALLTVDCIMVWISTIGLMQIQSPASLQPRNSCTQVLFSNQQLYFVTGGFVYRSPLNVQKKPRQHPTDARDDFIYPAGFHPFVREYECRLKYDHHVRRLENVSRVFCDADGKSFVALQRHSNRYMQYPQPRDEPMQAGFRALLTEACVDDGLVDLVFVVQGRHFVAHKFVVLSRAPQMAAIIAQASDGQLVRLSDEWLSAKMFELILKYVYENHTMTDEDVVAVKQSLGPSCGLDEKAVFNKFCAFAKRCGLLQFATGINKTHERTACTFNRLDHPDLCDVTLLCGEQRTIVRAHKCILVTRSEYFRMMFSRNWSESDTAALPHVNADSILPILDYLYANDSREVQRAQYTDAFLCEIILVCDLMLLHRLSSNFEHLLIDRITARKCLDILRFANDLSQRNVQEQCVRFVCTNAARMLDRRQLDDADAAIFRQVAAYAETELQLEGFKERYDALIRILLDKPLTMGALLEFVGKFTVDLGALPVQRKTGAIRKATDKVRSPPKAPLKAFDGDDLKCTTAASPPAAGKESVVLVEAARIADELCVEFERWSKVSGKRETAQKRIRPTYAHANEVLATETKADGDFVRLGALVEVSPDTAEAMEETGEESPRQLLNVNLMSLRGPNRRISQRERKRLSSESGSVGNAATADATPSPTETAPAGVWKINNNSANAPAPFWDGDQAVATKDSRKTASRRKEIRENFLQIQKEEQRDKDNFNRMMSKPLWMTQAEEAAIAELKVFYNIDKVFDENILVCRVPANPTSRSHAVWYQPDARNLN